MLRCRGKHDGLALRNMAIHLGQLDTQAQDFSAKGRVIDFLQDLPQGVSIYRAGIGPGELVAGQEVCT